MAAIINLDKQIEENVNWERVEAAKTAARKAIDEREEQRRQEELRVRTQLEMQSATRLMNVVKLLKDDIGDLVDEFTVYGEDSHEALMSSFGLCKATRTTFSLCLPHHNPIHVMVQFGDFFKVSNADGKEKLEWKSNDFPMFVKSESKFNIYVNPDFHKKVVGKVKTIRRVEAPVNPHGIAIAQPKSQGFNDIGESLIVAEEMWKRFNDPSANDGKYITKLVVEQSEEDDRKAKELLHEEQTHGPGVTTLKDTLQSLFTLNRRYEEHAE